MTIHISKRALIVSGVIAAIMLAFVAGRVFSGSSDSSTSSNNVASRGGESAPACERSAAWDPVEQALVENGDESEQLFDDTGAHIRRDISFEVVGCQDLTGDGQEEMVVTADGASASYAHAVSWFILQADGGDWKVVSYRVQAVPEIKLTADGVEETTPAFGPRDASCCPSSKRVGLVKFVNGKFIYEPTEGSRDRKITLGPDKTIMRLGPVDVHSATSAEVISQLGTPTYTYATENESCPMSWADLGLTINFANLGGGDPCLQGAIGSLFIQGLAAEQAGWSGPNGIKLGDSLSKARSAFPGIRAAPSAVYANPDAPSGSNPWWMVSAPSTYGSASVTPIVTGYFLRDKLKRMEFYVGAAGE